MKINSKHRLPRTIRTETRPYLIFIIFFTPLLGPWTYTSLIDPEMAMWGPILITFITLVIIFLYLASFKIILTNDGLFYKAGFYKEKILYSNIKEIRLKLLSRTESFKHSGVIVMEIYTKTKETPIVLNIKPFSRHDLSFVINTATSRNADIQLDKPMQQIKNGSVKPLLSFASSSFWRYLAQALLAALAVVLIKHFIF